MNYLKPLRTRMKMPSPLAALKTMVSMKQTPFFDVFMYVLQI